MPEVPRGRSHHWGSETINCSVDLPVVSLDLKKKAGRYPYRPTSMFKASTGCRGFAKKKSRCSVPGLPPLMTWIRSNRAHKHLYVRLIRPSRSRWYLKPCFNRVTTEELQLICRAGATEPPSLARLAGGFVRQKKEPPSSD